MIHTSKQSFSPFQKSVRVGIRNAKGCLIRVCGGKYCDQIGPLKKVQIGIDFLKDIFCQILISPLFS